MQRSLILALFFAAITPVAQAETPTLPAEAEFTVDMKDAGPQDGTKGFVPNADYEIILQKLKSAPNLNGRIRQMVQMAQVGADPNMVEMMLNDITGGFRGTREKGLTEPLAYVLLGKVQMAQMRAQFRSQLLVSDLDDDGQITEQELRDTLSVSGEVGGAAEAFFLSDSNADHILSADELRAAVDHLLATRGGYRAGDRAELPRIFDFDDDGLLTQAEFDRAMVALGYGR